MVIVDANAVLRTILDDNEAMVNEVKQLIRHTPVLIKNEVMAEIVYVLARVYNVSKPELCRCILNLLKTENICVESRDVMLCAINVFEKINIDFVDSLLYAYHCEGGAEIFTFDKKLKNLINKGI